MQVMIKAAAKSGRLFFRASEAYVFAHCSKAIEMFLSETFVVCRWLLLQLRVIACI
jgi:hypothetical protein